MVIGSAAKLIQCQPATVNPNQNDALQEAVRRTDRPVPPRAVPFASGCSTDDRRAPVVLGGRQTQTKPRFGIVAAPAPESPLGKALGPTTRRLQPAGSPPISPFFYDDPANEPCKATREETHYGDEHVPCRVEVAIHPIHDDPRHSHCRRNHESAGQKPRNLAHVAAHTANLRPLADARWLRTVAPVRWINPRLANSPVSTPCIPLGTVATTSRMA